MREKISMVLAVIVVGFLCITAYNRVIAFSQKYTSKSDPILSSVEHKDSQQPKDCIPNLNSRSGVYAAPAARTTYDDVKWSVELPGDKKCDQSSIATGSANKTGNVASSAQTIEKDILLSGETFDKTSFDLLAAKDQISLLISEILQAMTVLSSLDRNLYNSCNEVLDSVHREQKSGRFSNDYIIKGFIGAYNHCTVFTDSICSIPNRTIKARLQCASQTKNRRLFFD